MLFRLITIVSSVNLFISAFIVFNVFQMRDDLIVPPTIASPNQNQNQNKKPNINDILKQNPQNLLKNYNLTNEEIEKLLRSGDPFGDSLSKNQSVKTKEEKDEESEEGDGNGGSSASQADRKQVDTIAEAKSKKYYIPKEWILAIIENTSNYVPNLVKIENGVTRKGIMQLREDQLQFILKNGGITFSADKVLELETNIELGTYYLSYLKNQNPDEHFIFTAYYLGEKEAENLYKNTSSYESDFSKKVVQSIGKSDG